MSNIIYSDLNWSTGFQGIGGIAVSGAYLYAVNNPNLSLTISRVSKINLSDGTIHTLDFITGLIGNRSIIINGNFIYVTNDLPAQDWTVSKYNLSDGTLVNLALITANLLITEGMATDGTYLYINNTPTGNDNYRISKYLLADGSLINANWVTGLTSSEGIVINGSYLYTTNTTNLTTFTNSIVKIELSSGTIINSNWATGFVGTTGLDIKGSYMYVTNNNNVGLPLAQGLGTISQVNLYDGSINNTNFITGLNNLVGLRISGSYMYVANEYLTSEEPPVGSGVISLFEFDDIISNICFPAGTPIKTDRGLIHIQEINPSKHTINYKKIVAITETVSKDDYLVCFKKHSLKYNVPSQDTLISKDHKILYENKFIAAENFLHMFKVNKKYSKDNEEHEKIIKVSYNGETLYNVLMEEHDTISVNNITCETLHPNNLVAKLYNSKLTPEFKQNMIIKMNKSINDDDYEYYKETTTKLNTITFLKRHLK